MPEAHRLGYAVGADMLRQLVGGAARALKERVPGPDVVADCLFEDLGSSGLVLGEDAVTEVRGCTVREARGNGLLAGGRAAGTVSDLLVQRTAQPGVRRRRSSPGSSGCGA